MANWAFGTVSVTGTRQNVLTFARRFIYENEENANSDTPYFGNCVVQKPRAEVMADISDSFKDKTDVDELAVTLYVDFAWSAHDCLINFQPQIDPERISITDACIADSVMAEIKAAEYTAGTEETIYCGKDGKYESQFIDMETVACEKCGAENHVPSFDKASECECGECGEKIVSDMEEDNACADT